MFIDVPADRRHPLCPRALRFTAGATASIVAVLAASASLAYLAVAIGMRELREFWLFLPSAAFACAALLGLKKWWRPWRLAVGVIAIPATFLLGIVWFAGRDDWLFGAVARVLLPFSIVELAAAVTLIIWHFMSAARNNAAPVVSDSQTRAAETH